jgi:hypothetical protein
MPVKLFLSVLVILIISHVVVAEDVNMYSFKSIAKQYISFDSTYLVISFVHPGDCVKCSVQPLKLLSEIEKIVPCKIVEAIFCQRKIEYDYQ